MCGRFALKTSTPELAAMLGVDLASVPEHGTALGPSYNVAPSQPVLVCFVDRHGNRRLARMRWGLVPSWSKDGGARFSMINARAETVAEKPAYRMPFRYRRCLIPADAFYEWRKLDDRKQPYCIRLRSGEPFAFAGVWERCRRGEGDAIVSCSIITTAANETLTPIHPRMPVILPRETFAEWLDPARTEAEALMPSLKPYPADEMEAFPVSTYVNKPANDDERCWEPNPVQS